MFSTVSEFYYNIWRGWFTYISHRHLRHILPPIFWIHPKTFFLWQRYLFFIYYSSSVQNLKIEILLNTRVQSVTCYPSIGQCIFKLYIYVIRKKKISLYPLCYFVKDAKILISLSLKKLLLLIPSFCKMNQRLQIRITWTTESGQDVSFLLTLVREDY